MKNQCIRAFRGRWLALLISALLLLGMLPAPVAAAEAGSLDVKLSQDTYDNIPKDPVVEVALYRIGSADGSTAAGWRIDEAFQGYGVLKAKTSAELGVVAENIARDIVGKDKYKVTTKPLTGGSAVFPVNEMGVYFGMATKAPEGVKVTPFIVTVPSLDPKTRMQRFSYPVVLKDSYVTSLTVEKKWDDADDQDGARPSFIEVTLSDGQKVTLNDDNEWTATIDDLPIYKDGEKINYTWTEAKVDGYTSAQVTDGIVTTLTNSHSPETTEATVKKVWNDANDQDGVRPAFIDVTLSNGQKVTLNEANSWTATVTGLPRYDKGQEIKYTWTEAKVDGYTSTQVTDGRITTLTNVHTPETTEATVKKVWQDDNDADKLRPDSITVTLSNGQTVTLNEANSWTATVTGLPKYDKGQEIKYTWTEAKVDGYTSTQVTDGTITTLTNVHAPTPTPTVEPTPTPSEPVVNPTPTPNTEVSGRKVWVDEGNAHKTRPASITVTLYANGTAQNAAPNWTNTNTDTWSYTFANLPAVDADGNAITYTVKETPVEGYTTTVSGTTITNTLDKKEPKEYKQLTGTKTWREVSAAELSAALASRPSEITVHLIRDGVEVGTATASAMSGWKYDFGKWPVDDGYGNTYEYTVREDAVTGYYARVDGLDLVNISLTTPDRPNRPYQPGVPVTPRKTITPPPPFKELNEEEMDELMDILDYGTPLWGTLLGTGDETPVYPYVFGGVGVLAIVALVLFGRKRKKKEK